MSGRERWEYKVQGGRGGGIVSGRERWGIRVREGEVGV